MSPSWHAAHTPDTPAIVMGSSGETVTYAQLDERSRRFARALRSRGVKVGDHLAILMGNHRAFLDPNGKLYKRLLRDRYWVGHESRVI
jgi:acyl-CoA synthetase (AMP-forming)/AMP-acid ligase II